MNSTVSRAGKKWNQRHCAVVDEVVAPFPGDKTHPAYYLRFCKSYSRMGAAMHYLQCDNLAFVHNVYRGLLDGDAR